MPSRPCGHGKGSDANRPTSWKFLETQVEDGWRDWVLAGSEVIRWREVQKKGRKKKKPGSHLILFPGALWAPTGRTLE